MKCSRCPNQTKPGKRYCVECQRAYSKSHYEKNKEKYVATALKNNPRYKNDRVDFVASLKLSCIKCGESHPAVLDFHHRDPKEKEWSVSQMVQRAAPREKILEEISKCDVLCSNCHRIHHWEERQCSCSPTAEAAGSNSVQ